MNDILEPVLLYGSDFKEAHRRHTEDYFNELARNARVDEPENIETIKQLRAAEAGIADARRSCMLWRCLRVSAIAGCVLLAAIAMQTLALALVCIPLVVSIAVSIKKQINPNIQHFSRSLESFVEQRDQRLKEAQAQMAPLNQLFHWGMFADLIRKTIPRIEIDPYFTNARLVELRKDFGWVDHSDPDASIIFAHSGHINGNPLLIGQKLVHWMGTATYTGYLTITYTKSVRSSDGKTRNETHTQVLSASLTKPKPEYAKRAVIYYGNEAAPDLKFSRNPSTLSKTDGLIGKIGKAWTMWKLEARARKSNTNFTLMSNRDFDVLFGATDRNHEVQFRLLFTALAQQEMLNLLKDRRHGFGDNFSFTKTNMVNVIEPSHMHDADIGSNPAIFWGHDLADMRQRFILYQAELFRTVYFGLAPLLTIPLYQQHRPHNDIYSKQYRGTSAYWEHESIANYFGQDRFRPASCVTQCILKTSASLNSDGTQDIRVTASGFAAVERLTFVGVYGNDGKRHQVPVKWIEYVPVSRESGFVLKDPENCISASNTGFTHGDWQRVFRQRGMDPSQAILRRAIYAILK
jgi:hypothetical protein